MNEYILQLFKAQKGLKNLKRFKIWLIKNNFIELYQDYINSAYDPQCKPIIYKGTSRTIITVYHRNLIKKGGL